MKAGKELDALIAENKRIQGYADSVDIVADDLRLEIAALKLENERLAGLVDIENTYGHLYLVAIRYVKNEWGEDKYWELFEAVCRHFDALLKGADDE